jgi:hypothetical protein
VYKLVAQSLSDAEKEFRREVEKELTGRERESWEIVCFRMANPEGHLDGGPKESRSHSGHDSEENLTTRCNACHTWVNHHAFQAG